MASDIEMSLDDIIHKKKQNKRHGNTIKKHVSAPDHSDARNKIISKKRSRIVDAREKLIALAKKKDARLKLDHLRTKKFAVSASLRKLPFTALQDNGHWPLLNVREPVFSDSSRRVSSQAAQKKHNINKRQAAKRSFLESRTIASRSLGYPMKINPILRTVENDVIVIDANEDNVVSKTITMDRKASLNLKIIARNPGARERNSSFKRTIEREKERSPPRPPSILKKRPMAALRMEKVEKPEPTEYRIIVSNLRNSVTGGDIQELFEDIGGLKESRLVRPGTAEVIYGKLEDAQRAVDLYHNRQLDGQPMNCLLVNPRTTKNTTSRSGGLPASSSSNVEPDISTFHKVLFSNF